METLFFIGASTLLIYTLYVIYKVGVLPSFSDSFYELKENGWLFQINMLVMTLSLTPVILEVTKDQWWQFIAFFTIAPIAFVGAAPKFKPKKSLERDVHMRAAFISAIGSITWVILVSIYITPVAWFTIPISGLIMFLGYIFNNKKNGVWWAEFACFMWTLMTIGILLFMF